MPLSWSAFWTVLTCSEPAPPSALMPECDPLLPVPVAMPAPDPVPELGVELVPPLGALVPDCPMFVPDFAFPVAPEPVPGGRLRGGPGLGRRRAGLGARRAARAGPGLRERRRNHRADDPRCGRESNPS